MTPNDRTPTLDDLTARFLSAAATEGGLDTAADESSEVEPYEVIGGFQPSPAELWRESRQGLAGSAKPLAAPPEWAAFVTHDSQSLNHVPAAITPFAAGLFPQRLRNFAALSHLTSLCTPSRVRPHPRLHRAAGLGGQGGPGY